MGGARGTTGRANQRSDTGKGLADQGTKRDAPGQPRRLALLEGGSTFSHRLSFAVAKIEQCPQVLLPTRNARSAQPGAGAEPRLHTSVHWEVG